MVPHRSNAHPHLQNTYRILGSPNPARIAGSFGTLREVSFLQRHHRQSVSKLHRSQQPNPDAGSGMSAAKDQLSSNQHSRPKSVTWDPRVPT